MRKVEVLPASQCQCWDCLREIGLTPPKFMRDKYKRLYPSREMHQTVNSRGQIYFTPGTREDDGRERSDPGFKVEPAGQSNLREAVKGQLV